VSNRHDAEVRTYVYRIFDREGRLIYVGATMHPETRINTHRRSIWWGLDIHRIKIKVYPNRQLAADEERRAVQTEHPRWNLNLRNWKGPSWTIQTYRDFLTALERNPESTTDSKVARIATVRRQLKWLEESAAESFAA